MNYQDFIASKKHSLGNCGFPAIWMPEKVFDFQHHIIEKALLKGRIGVFADTGLGKTRIQLVIAENIVRKTNGNVLILTPLAVAFQFIDEASLIGVDDIGHTRDGKIKNKITVCNTAVHCTDVFDNSCRLWDFPHEIIRIHDKYGFQYRNRITIWKEPLKVRMRTMVKSLMHKLIVEDSTQCFTAMPDYVLIFTKKGDNAVPVTHPNGLNRYFGDTPILPNILRAFNNANETKFTEDQLWEYLNKNYIDHDDPKSNKLSHYIWQRYASSVWDDIRIDNVLPFRDSKEEDDEKHVHPLQLDVIDRLVELYSNTGEVVLTPFMGVGSEVYSPVSLGRKAIGIELKDSYYKQAKINLSLVDTRFVEDQQKQNVMFA